MSAPWLFRQPVLRPGIGDHPIEMSDPSMGPPVLLFGPSRLVRELRAFCVPELLTQWHLAAQQTARNAAAAVQADAQPPPPPPPPLAVHPVPGGLLAQLGSSAHPDEQLLAAAAGQCTLLTAALRPVAAAASLEAAAAGAMQQLPPGTAQRHPLRTVCLDGSSARGPAERALRQRLQQLGLGSAPDPKAAPLWCIHHRAGWPLGSAAGQQQEAADHFLLGLQVAVGAPLSAAAAVRRLGPTAMLPELAALSCSLAAVRSGSLVLDPFCGTGSLLAAAADTGAALTVGSDIDSTHFARVSGSGGLGSSQQQDGGAGAAPVLLQADVACLQQLLPPATVDALVTDLPYGYRTEVAVDGAATAAAASAAATAAAADGSADGDLAPAAAQEAESWQHLLAVLLRLASHVLVPGGRMLAWMPLQPGSSNSSSGTPNNTLRQSGGVAAEEAATERQRQQLKTQGQQHGLRLLHLLPESRQGGYPRAVAVFELQGGSSEGSCLASAADPASRQRQLLAALDAALEAELPAFNLPSQPKQQHQDQPAEQSQAGSIAATAGPAQCAPAAQGGPAPAAVEQRGLHYKQVRGACKGAAIDVWR